MVELLATPARCAKGCSVATDTAQNPLSLEEKSRRPLRADGETAVGVSCPAVTGGRRIARFVNEGEGQRQELTTFALVTGTVRQGLPLVGCKKAAAPDSDGKVARSDGEKSLDADTLARVMRWSLAVQSGRQL